MKNRSILAVLACALMIVFTASCATARTTTALPPSATSSPSTAETTAPTPITSTAVVDPPVSLPVVVPVTTATGIVTFGDLISPGRLYYANYCMGCHGADGQGQNGPPLWPPAGTLGKRDNAVFFDNNAQAMLDFISSFMPIGWASLSPVQYTDITAFLLVQDGRISPFDVFDKTRLKDIMIRQ